MLFEQGKPQRSLLEYHQRLGAFSADCGITFPVTPLTTIIDVSRALVDTGSLGDQHAFLARIFPFSPVFSSTLEIFREIAPGFEDELVDFLVTHSFSWMVDRETTGNLLGAPTELQFLFDVLLDSHIANTWAGATQFPSPREPSVRTVGLIPPVLGAVRRNLSRYH